MNTEFKADFESLINEAWELHDAALLEEDFELAELFKEEAFSLLAMIPGNTILIRTEV